MPEGGVVIKNAAPLEPQTSSGLLDHAKAQAETIRMNSEGWGPGLGLNVDPGDKLTFTIGAETYAPVPYNTFTVGPFSATVTVRKGEDLAETYMRAYRFLATVFEAELVLKKKHFWDRMAEAGENPVKNKGGKS